MWDREWHRGRGDGRSFFLATSIDDGNDAKTGVEHVLSFLDDCLRFMQTTKLDTEVLR